MVIFQLLNLLRGQVSNLPATDLIGVWIVLRFVSGQILVNNPSDGFLLDDSVGHSLFHRCIQRDQRLVHGLIICVFANGKPVLEVFVEYVFTNVFQCEYRSLSPIQKESLKLLNEFLFVVPEGVAVHFAAVLQVIDRLCVRDEVGVCCHSLHRSFVRKVSFIGRVAAVKNEVEHVFGNLAVVLKEFAVDVLLESGKVRIDSGRLWVGSLYAAFLLVPGSGRNRNAG